MPDIAQSGVVQSFVDWYRSHHKAEPVCWVSEDVGDDRGIDVEFARADGTTICLQMDPLCVFMLLDGLREYLTPERVAMAILARETEVAEMETYQRDAVHSKTLCGTSSRDSSA
jgi:hypothetical protein